MYIVYALASLNKKYVYVGLTSDIEKRLKRHNGKLERTTKPYAPFIIIYEEVLEDRPKARTREKFFKSRNGKRQLYQLIKEKNYPRLAHYL